MALQRIGDSGLCIDQDWRSKLPYVSSIVSVLYMFNFLRRLLGLDQQLHNNGLDIEAKPNARPSEERKLYLGRPVPLEASHDPEEFKVFYAEFAEEFLVAPANDGSSVLVFSTYFQSESAEDKSVVYDEWEMTVRRDPRDHPKRLSDTVRIYEHLFRDRQPHPRVVRYLGPTPSGYRLERLSPGDVRPCTNSDNDAVLALHQRWALQILSALQWIHERGVTIQRGAIQKEAMWLRSDLSIAVAGFITAGCLELDIPAEHWSSWNFVNPYGPQMSGHSAPPYTWRDTGLPKGDLVDWATWVYGLMIGGENDPLMHDVNCLDGTKYIGLSAERHRAAEEGTFTNWPRLSKERLGEVLIRAWSGEYETAKEVLEDVRRTLMECGRSLTAGKTDEIDGFDWTSLFKIGEGQFGKEELKLAEEYRRSGSRRRYQVVVKRCLGEERARLREAVIPSRAIGPPVLLQYILRDKWRDLAARLADLAQRLSHNMPLRAIRYTDPSNDYRPHQGVPHKGVVRHAIQDLQDVQAILLSLVRER